MLWEYVAIIGSSDVPAREVTLLARSERDAIAQLKTQIEHIHKTTGRQVFMLDIERHPAGTA